MKVLHLIKSLGRGGAEVLLAEGLAVADRRRFDFSYAWFLPWKDALVPALEAQGATVTCLGARSNAAILAAAGRVARHLRAQRVDVVHAHLPIAGVVARLAGRLAGVPVVYTEHNVQERYHAATRWLNLRTWRWQSAVVAVSSDVADSIARHATGGVPVEVIRNGVNVDRFAPAAAEGAAVRQTLAIPADAPVVGTVAVLRAQKRLDQWLDVADRVRRVVPGTHFLVVGDGPERAATEAAAARAGHSGVMHFVGLQEDARPYIAAMDVYLMTSQFEGLPIALLEAMAMEVPPVATAVGGIPEVIETGVNGRINRFGDVAGLAADVARLLADADRRKALGRAARRSVVEHFGMRRMQRALEGVYERVVAERAAAEGDACPVEHAAAVES